LKPQNNRLFGLTVKSTKLKQFSTFSKLLRVKQLVDSTKQQVVFHLVGKTLDIKKGFKLHQF